MLAPLHSFKYWFVFIRNTSILVRVSIYESTLFYVIIIITIIISCTTCDDTPKVQLFSKVLLTMQKGPQILTFFAALGGMLFGYDTGIISGSILFIRQEFNLSPLQESWVVSVTIVGAMLGALLAGPLNDRFGRRPATLLSSSIFMVGAVLMAFAPELVTLISGRLLVGVAIGVASMTSPMYISEVAPVKQRGTFVSFNVLAITGGQCLAYLVALTLSDHEFGWRLMMGLSALPALLQFLGMLIMPESPRFLLMRGMHDEARKARKFFKQADIHAEGSNANHSPSPVLSAPSVEKSIVDTFTSIWHTPAHRKALLIAVGLLSFQQLCGINVAMYYSASIIRMAGVDSNTHAILLSTVVAAANALATCLSLVLIDRVGRRPLLLVTTVGVILSLIGLAAGFQTMPTVGLDNTRSSLSDCNQYATCQSCFTDSRCGVCTMDNVTSISESVWGQCRTLNATNTCSNWISDSIQCPPLQQKSIPTSAIVALVSLTFYVLFIGSGLGCVPWTVMSEVFPSSINGFGSAVSTTANWTLNFVVSLTFLPLSSLITVGGTFYVYAGLSVLALLFIYFVVPETKGKSLDEIQYMLGGSSLNEHRYNHIPEKAQEYDVDIH